MRLRASRLFGGIGGFVRGIMGFFGERVDLLAAGGQIAMGVLCGVFVALCVKSFIDRPQSTQTSGGRR